MESSPSITFGDARGSRGGFRGRARGEYRSRGQGRGRGQGTFSRTWNNVPSEKEEDATKNSSKRLGSVHFANDSTDKLITPPEDSSRYLHTAGVVLRHKVQSFTTQYKQAPIRDFVNSCLLNLSSQNGMDTSGVLAELCSEAGCTCLEWILNKPMSTDAGFHGTKLSFQYIILPLIGVLTRESVCQSIMTTSLNRLYSIVYTRRGSFLEDVLDCMDKLIKRGSLLDGTSDGFRMATATYLCQVPSLQHALLAICRLVFQLIKRIEDAKFELESVIGRVSEQRKACLPKAGMDTEENCFLGEILAKEVARLAAIISDAHSTIIESGPEPEGNSHGPKSSRNRGPNMVHLDREYDPPGDLSRNGPRHDNDYTDISLISVEPTFEELASTRDPFIPSNCIPEARHFLPHGWKRQLDIHFRLYREDLMGHLRKGLSAFLEALSETKKDKEDDLLRKRVFKGKYENFSVDVYGSVQFHSVDYKKQARHSAIVTFRQPHQVRRKSHEKRKDFWERSKKRLMLGALVFMVIRTDNNEGDSKGSPETHFTLGTVADRDIDELSQNEDYARIRISLMDPKLYVAMINATNPHESNRKLRQWLLVEPSVGYFEFYRPVLKVLQAQLPSTMPFGKYLAPTKEETEAMLSAKVKIDPPMYARAPDFRFNLSTLMKGQGLELDVTSPASAEMVVKALQECESLDDTQSRALVDALCREVALISGPPGTGKTRIGVELMRVLLDNVGSIGDGPILCICYTNHALDQFLEHILDKGISNIIRIGSRSKSKRMDAYSLEDHVKAYEKPYHLKKAIRDSIVLWESLSDITDELQKALQGDELHWAHVERFLQRHHPTQWTQLFELPLSDIDEDDDFTTVRHGTQQREVLFYRWVEGVDIKEKERWNQEMQDSKETPWLNTSVNPYALLADENDESEEEEDQGPFMYEIPNTDRPLEELLDGDVWEMSISERWRLMDSWRPRIRTSMMNELTYTLEEVMETLKEKDNYFDEIRRDLLCQASVIGITTGGAARHQALINAVAPKIIICEEAGEVLESHILATLSSSTQHLIMIGDHLQLRPQIQTHNLTSDSAIGRNYNLDISLFERLVTAKTNPLPSSHLTVQRRMRPEISSLIRKTLYPYLEDGDNVNYPDVSGMSSNLYFMDHSHPVDSKDQYSLQSFSNTFEVKMVEALVHYLIMNGYNRPGDIAVLTPYLGQLSKLRACLGGSFMLVMSEKDEEQLEMQDAENESGSKVDEIEAAVPTVMNVPLKTRLTLQTIDNYQGEEAKVVIVSLVRSDVREDGMADSSATIGFLKSSNRTNVLLSRAQHGMYLIGNANLMEKKSHGIWRQVITDLRESGRIGQGFPLVCKKHPDVANVVNTPEMLRKVSPNGGCNRPCGYNIPCGHVCPLMCHPGDFEHKIAKCSEPCMRLQPHCLHVCPKKCGDPCGDCMVVVGPIELQCGHALDQPKCHQARDPSKVHCKVKVTKKPPSCGHEYVTECGKADADTTCNRPCGSVLNCGHTCQYSCSKCKELVSGSKKTMFGLILTDHEGQTESRTEHGACLAKCNLVQPCGHTCESNCHTGKPCPPCAQPCLRKCAHDRCHKLCNDPCDVCLKPCTWECPHFGRCTMPCGLPCDRPPCDNRCEKILGCGHQCPSVCGEECPPQRFCVECKDVDSMNLQVSVQPGVVLLRDLDVNNDPVLALACGHAVAMSTLDYESTKTTNPNEKHSVRCPWCQRWTTNLMRYRHQLVHLRLQGKVKGDLASLSGMMSNALKRLEMVVDGVGGKKTPFMHSLLVTEAPPPKNSLKTKERRLGKPDKRSFPFPQSDVKTLSRIYGIPTTDEIAWKVLIEPLVASMQQFTTINWKASEAIAKKTSGTTAKGHFNSAAKKNTTRQDSLAPSKVPVKEMAPKATRTGVFLTQTEGDNIWSESKDSGKDLETTPENTLDTTADSEKSKVEPGKEESPEESILVDSMQERIHILFILLSLAFAALDVAGSWSGWYWFIEDLIHCIQAHITLARNVASRENHRRRVVEVQLMQLDLLCKKMLWVGLKPLPTDLKAKVVRSLTLEKLQGQAEAEQTEVRKGCVELGMDKHLTLAYQLKAKMARAIKVANRETLTHSMLWGDESAPSFRIDMIEVQAPSHSLSSTTGPSSLLQRLSKRRFFL